MHRTEPPQPQPEPQREPQPQPQPEPQPHLTRSRTRTRTPPPRRAAPPGHPRRRPLLRTALALCGWPALAATALPDGSPLRWIPVLLFVGFGPGSALLLPLPDGLRPAARLEALALAAPLSLSLAALTATVLFLVAGFSATLFLGSLAALCTIVAPLPAVPLPAATRGAAERVKRTPGSDI
jgi:hypothetical protein